MRVIEKQTMAVIDTIRYDCHNSMKIVTIDGIGPKSSHTSHDSNRLREKGGEKYSE